MNAEIIQVVVLLPDHTPPDARARPVFDYAAPAGLRGRLAPGHLVLVPFGQHAAGEARLVSGIVFRLAEQARPGVELKPVHDWLDPRPVMSAAQLQLAQWMSDYYGAPLCECVRPFAPPGQSVHSDLEYALAAPSPQLTLSLAGESAPPRLGSLQSRIVALLNQRGPLRAGQLSAALHGKDWSSAIQPLIARGVVTATRVLPLPRTRPHTARVVELGADPAAILDDALGRNPHTIQRRRRALAFLEQQGRGAQVEWVYAESGCTAADLGFLEKKGLVKIRLQEVLRDPLAGQEFVLARPPVLTAEQAAAWQRLQAGIEQLAAGPVCVPPYLLHGVTGSGKTELYMRAVAEILAAGRQAIVMVPEISLTPQTIRRFAARFPGHIAVWHSQMSLDEKYDTWRRIRAGQADVVIGPRSALFSPLERLGLIVLDEEHEASYKQDIDSRLPFELPAYHAREVALELARLVGAVVILGSATPSLESYVRARRGEFVLVELPQRILSHEQNLLAGQERHHVETRYQVVAGAREARFIDLPPVQVVDMRLELRAGNRHIFSRALQAALGEVLEKHQQAILFLNRRGSATFVLCRDCGHVMACPRCDLPLTYHEASPAPPTPAPSEMLICHQCNHRQPTPERCPRCRSLRIKYFGLGTQRVEKAVAEQYPQARVLRWDADTTMGRGAHELFLQQFAQGHANVMVGTQMIAKGLDLPLVTLVGVISADTSLRLPDLRAAERTFQLLAQVAGRAGRGLLGGRVIVQTYAPEHYAVQAAARHDYAGFARQELAFRRQMDYPPFTRLARLVVHDVGAGRARREAERMAGLLAARLEAHGLDSRALIGPAPCFLERLRDQYRWQIILRAPDPASVLRALPLSPAWRVDIDPISLL